MKARFYVDTWPGQTAESMYAFNCTNKRPDRPIEGATRYVFEVEIPDPEHTVLPPVVATKEES